MDCDTRALVPEELAYLLDGLKKQVEDLSQRLQQQVHRVLACEEWVRQNNRGVVLWVCEECGSQQSIPGFIARYLPAWACEQCGSVPQDDIRKLYLARYDHERKLSAMVAKQSTLREAYGESQDSKLPEPGLSRDRSERADRAGRPLEPGQIGHSPRR